MKRNIRFGLWDTKCNRFLLLCGGETLVRVSWKTSQAASDEIKFLESSERRFGLVVKKFEANNNEL